MLDLAANVRRLMARSGMTFREVIEATGLSQRTVKAILRGQGRPHARTLHRLAAGFGVGADELFQTASSLTHRTFDEQTNPLVQQLVDERPELFEHWTAAEFQEMYSRFGVGGALTYDGALGAAEAMNRKRRVHQKVALLLETPEADFLTGVVDLLYQRVLVSRS